MEAQVILSRTGVPKPRSGIQLTSRDRKTVNISVLVRKRQMSPCEFGQVTKEAQVPNTHHVLSSLKLPLGHDLHSLAPLQSLPPHPHVDTLALQPPSCLSFCKEEAFSAGQWCVSQDEADRDCLEHGLFVSLLL